MLRDDLIAARALIDTPEKWGRGLESFENGYAYAPKPRYPMCALGACAASAMRDAMWNEGGCDRYTYMQMALERHTADGHSVASFNDRHATTHADIMALFDRAIQAATPEPENKS